MKGRTVIRAAIAVTVVLSPQLFAQAMIELDIGGLDHRATDKATWTVGLGVGAAPDYEGGDHYEGVPIPIMEVQKGNRYAELLGLHAKSNLLDSPHWRLGPSLNFRQGYNDVGNNRVESLSDRGNSTELGAKGGYEFHLQGDAALEVAVEVLADVSSGHDGALVTPSVSYLRPLNARWVLGLGANITWADGNYMSHYFSVNNRDSLATGLKNYDADRDFKDAAADVALVWDWTDRWRVIGVAEYKRMLGDASDSPVVDDEGSDNQFFGGATVTYTWD